MRNKTPITSVENLDSVLEILKVLIREGIQQAQGYPGGPVQRRAQETEETIEEQGWLARIVHLLHGKDNDTQFKVSFWPVSCESSTLTWCLASSVRTQSIFGRQ
jgi:vacuolar protein sorting-associated protein 35